MVTKTEVSKSGRGYNFSITWDNRSFPNFVSALYKTKREATDQLKRYLKDGSFDWYGSAE